jgi:hypothetical protein
MNMKAVERSGGKLGSVLVALAAVLVLAPSATAVIGRRRPG